MKNDIKKMRELISILRGRRGCAWDRRQTPRSLAPLVIEEVHEMVEAVERGDRKLFREEFGDLLFLALSILQAAEDRGLFSSEQMVEETVQKYVTRHPHVFGRRENLTPSEILVRWEKGKARKDGRHPVDRVPHSLPALYQAKRIYEKASRVGMIRLKKRRYPGAMSRIGAALLKLARKAVESGVDPEAALRRRLRELRRDLKKKKII
ncbi:hypothetical protein HY522_01620 [bacterium]|nr:hypothetical protein [bacterium]